MKNPFSSADMPPAPSPAGALAPEKLGFLFPKALTFNAADLAEFEPGSWDFFPALDTVLAVKVWAGLGHDLAARASSLNCASMAEARSLSSVSSK